MYVSPLSHMLYLPSLSTVSYVSYVSCTVSCVPCIFQRILYHKLHILRILQRKLRILYLSLKKSKHFHSLYKSYPCRGNCREQRQRSTDQTAGSSEHGNPPPCPLATGRTTWRPLVGSPLCRWRQSPHTRSHPPPENTTTPPLF